MLAGNLKDFFSQSVKETVQMRCSLYLISEFHNSLLFVHKHEDCEFSLLAFQILAPKSKVFNNIFAIQTQTVESEGS